MKLKHVILFGLLLSTLAFSQIKNKNRVGLGVSIDPATIGHISYYSNSSSPVVQEVEAPILFYIPVNITDSIRIEPLFGLRSSNNTTTDHSQYVYGNTNSNSITTNTVKISAIVAGIRVYYYQPLSENFALYVGPKFSVSFQTLEFQSEDLSNYNANYTYRSNGTKTNETDLTYGIIVGGEYFPVSHFSLGAEANINYTVFGDPKVTETNIPETTSYVTDTKEREYHQIHTDALIFVRWYFLF